MLLRDSIPISDGISNDFGSYSVRLDSFSNLMLNCWVQKGHNYVPRSQEFFPIENGKKPWERGCKALLSTRTVLERLCPSESQNRSRIEAELQPRRYLIFLR